MFPNKVTFGPANQPTFMLLKHAGTQCSTFQMDDQYICLCKFRFVYMVLKFLDWSPTPRAVVV